MGPRCHSEVPGGSQGSRARRTGRQLRTMGARLGFCVAGLGLASSCGSTLDSLGCAERAAGLDGGSEPVRAGALGSLKGPASYPNAFRELLGRSDGEIAAKIERSFQQLFHGDPATEAIFVPVGNDQAYILDVLHDEVRSEGIGLGMLIAVQLGKRDEFDRLWRYAQAHRVPSGAAQGYFPSRCNEGTAASYDCHDPYGYQQIATTLLLAHGRWRAEPGSIDYGQAAAELIDLARNQQAYNCGVREGVTSIFDASSALPYDVPTTAAAGISRPSIVMPAYYELWEQATGDGFWGKAADAARAYWRAAAHPSTGLIPEKAAFDGSPVEGYGNFTSECDRAFFSMVTDHLWSGRRSWLEDEANRILQFFHGQGLTDYGQVFTLDGTELQPLHDMPLVAANGALALVATMDRRADFVNEVWILETPTGSPRYYAGIMQLLSLVYLSGQMRVY